VKSQCAVSLKNNGFEGSLKLRKFQTETVGQGP